LAGKKHCFLSTPHWFASNTVYGPQIANPQSKKFESANLRTCDVAQEILIFYGVEKFCRIKHQGINFILLLNPLKKFFR
jgi:hypothetical protein